MKKSILPKGKVSLLSLLFILMSFFAQSKQLSATAGTGRRILMIVTDRQIYNQTVQATYNPQPGDTLVIPTSNLISFNISHFAGAPGKPIVIVPSDSSYMGGYSSYCGNITYARYFKLTGFHIDGSRAPSSPAVFSNFGMAIGAQTDHYEACNLYIKNAGIGFCAKQNPDKSFSAGSFPNYVLDSIYIHDISVKKTETEGFYIGYTNDVTSPLASPLKNLRIDHLSTDSTGWDGVQLSDCQNVFIHDIQVNHYGMTNSSGQQNGMLFGGEVTLRDSAYNINVSNGTGAGLIIFGRQLFKVTDVTLTNTAQAPGESAIYASDFADLGYNISPLQLDLRRITVDGASKYALDNANNNGTTLPGHVSGLKYTNTGMTIYDLLDVFDAPAANLPLVANAGADLNITLPVSSATLNGSAKDADGTISGYNWTKISGPAGFTISNPSAPATSVSNLATGTYVFRLSVKDNGGLTASDDVTVLVNPAVTTPPVANAGANLSILLPSNSVTLNGSASSPAAGIVNYNWTKTEGPSQFTIASPSAINTIVNNLVAGTYKFQLVVKDAAGKSGSATVSVVVGNPAKTAPVNVKPTSNAGSDQTITLPVSSVVLNGKASYDPDGYVLRYYWMKIKGTGGYVENSTSMSTNVTGLKDGVYIFMLYVTDNSGAMATSNVTVTVKAANKSSVALTGLNTQNNHSLVATTNAFTAKQGDAQKETLLLYPNPCEADLHIRYNGQNTGKITLIINDVLGRPLMTKEFMNTATQLEKTINVTGLKTGTYYLTIIPQTGNKITTSFIKK